MERAENNRSFRKQSPEADSALPRESASPKPCPMTDKEFSELSQKIQEKCGIYLPLSKKYLMEGRLKKRLVQLRQKTYRQYLEYLADHRGGREEMVAMIDAITTNKTDFFRENHQFEFLIHEALPQLIEESSKRGGHVYTIWSAACSSGEEPYTLGMVLSEYGSTHPGFNFHILATDISTKVLEEAIRGIYTHKRVEPVPLALRKKYLLRSKSADQDLVKIHPDVQKKITFRHLNLMESNYGIPHPMSIIFCRNVIIYFDKLTQLALLHRLCQHLVPQGYLFMGHSEMLNNADLPLTPVAPSVYRKM
jgi:chemotaxis protein methyltransferase CheR